MKSSCTWHTWRRRRQMNLYASLFVKHLVNQAVNIDPWNRLSKRGAAPRRVPDKSSGIEQMPRAGGEDRCMKLATAFGLAPMADRSMVCEVSNENESTGLLCDNGFIAAVFQLASAARPCPTEPELRGQRPQPQCAGER